MKSFIRTICSFSLILVLISQSAYAVIIKKGVKLYVSAEEQLAKDIEFLLDPKEVSFSGEHNPYSEAREILLLGDGYVAEGANKLKWTSLSDQIQDLVSKDATIHKTDFTCPDYEKSGNIILQKVDHTKPLEFHNDRFDTITMRRGLCLCHGNQQTCGGLNLNSDQPAQFLYHVSRILNKDNPHAIAYLDGKSLGRYPVLDAYGQNIWKVAVKEILNSDLNVNVSMIYLIRREIKEKLLMLSILGRHAEAQTLADKISRGDAEVYRFSGIRITPKAIVKSTTLEDQVQFPNDEPK